jgi:hypothetical protein
MAIALGLQCVRKIPRQRNPTQTGRFARAPVQMNAARMNIEQVVRAEPESDLYALLLQAARACSEATQGAVGVLDVELSPKTTDSLLGLWIEAEFAYQDGRRVIDGLDVRVRAPNQSRSDVERILAAGLRRFGGSAFTNLCAGPSGKGGLDITVSFSSRLPLWSERLLLLPERPEAEEARRYASILELLGINRPRFDKSPPISRHAFMRRITLETQAGLYTMARDQGMDASIYCATIPTSQAFRMAESRDLGDGVVDVVMSRGLSATRVCTSADAGEMSAFLAEYFGFSASEHEYRACNHIAEAKRPVDPIFKGHQRKRLGAGSLR